MNQTSDGFLSFKGLSVPKKVNRVILASLLAVIIPFIVIFILILSVNNEKNNAVVHLRQKNFEAAVDRLLAQREERLHDLVRNPLFTHAVLENGYRTQKKETVFSSGVIRPFHLKAALLYDHSRRLIWSETEMRNTPEFSGMTGLFGRLDSGVAAYAVSRCDEGFVELEAVKTARSGTDEFCYLIIASIWEQPFIEQLAAVTGSRIEFHETGHSRESDPSESRIIRTLRDFQGQAVTDMHWIRNNPFGRTFVDLTTLLYWILFSLAIAVTGIMMFVVQRRVIKPLSAVTRSLRDYNPELLQPILQRRDEMGVIAGLTRRYFDQQKLLESEIAERRKADETVRRNEAELESLFRATPVGIGTVADRVFRKVNERLCRMTGYSEAELLGQNSRMLYPDQETYDNVGKVKYDQIEKSGVGIIETRWKKKDGSIIHILLSSAVMDAAKPGEGVIFTALDITEHTAALDKLRESETEYRELYESTQDAVMILNEEGFTDCNPATLKIFGCSTKDQFVGHHPSEFSPPKQANGMDSMELASERIKQAIREGRCFFDWIHRRADGSDFDAEVLLSAVHIKGKTILQAVVRNVTERKHAEKLIQDSEKKYHSLVDNIGVGIAIVDIEERFTFVNPAAAGIFGVSEDALIGQSIRSFVTQDMYERIIIQTALRRKGMKTSYELDIIRPDNEYRYLLATVTPHSDEQGGFVGSFAILLDITDRKRIQEALHRSEDRYKQITDHMLDMVSRLDGNGNLIYISPSHRQILGFRPEDMLGRSYLDFIHPDDSERFLNAIYTHIQNHKTVKLEFRFQHSEGHYLWLEAVGNPLIGADMAVTGSVFATRDISQRKSMEEALRESRQMLQTVLDTIPVGVFWKNRDKTYLGCNHKFAEDNGFKKPIEVMGKSDFDLYMSESEANHFRSTDQTVIESGRAMLNYEEQHFHDHNMIRWTRTSKIPLRNAGQEIIGVLGVYEDITEQKEADLFLKESEEKYRRLVELSPWPIAVHKEGKIQYINQAGAKMMGCLNPLELIGQPLMQFVHPDYRNAILERIKTMNEQLTEVPVMEEKFIRLDQSVIDVEVAAIPFTQKGETFIQAMIRDITDRKRAETELILKEATLRKEQRFTQLLLDTSPAFIVAIGADGNTRMMNRALLEALEYSAEEVTGRDYLRSFVPEADRPQLMDIFIDILEKDKPTVNENRIISRTGKIYLVEWHGKLAVSKDDQQQFLVGVGTDITRRKETEDALKQSEKRYRDLVDQSLGYICVHDMEGFMSMVNPASAHALNYDPEELTGRKISDVLAAPYRKRFQFYLDAIREQKSYSGLMHVVDRQNNRKIWMFNNRMYEDENHQPYVLCNAQDITELENNRKERERLIKELQSAIHEVRTLSGLLPICAACKKIRDDKGYWNQLETYITDHSEAEFTHGICPDCRKKLYPELYTDED